ncbi:retrotransposon protein, putative, ty1-copia subclass [Tanacetum coccineum]|uniref:Retrotransposon protein, putative, ty1-copia subclass n=1 Tax=Tanacetum coccineum TaxID=301880 RepID=A0ABQ5GUY7_9ASTR
MFEREKLSGTNFNDWFRSLKLVLRVGKKLFVIEQLISPAPPADSTAQVLAQWNAVYDAHNEELKSMFGKQDGVKRFDLIQTFHACKQEEGKSVSLYVLNMKRYVEQLECLGYVLPQDLGVGLIMTSLEKSLPKKAATPQVMAIQGGKIQKGNKKSLNAKGKGKGKGKGKDKGYIPKPKNSKPYAKEHPAKDDAYHHYKEVGHCKRNSPAYLAELVKKKKQVGTTSSSVSKNHVLYFNAISSDGIYEIDMLNLVPNVNSIYNDSYFITFTGDYSRYGYVYLLKHKYEVFETFKLTPPYTPQHHGVSKRRNHTLLDMVRSMMNLTTLPLSFWDYALESATRILNMVPTKKVDKTTYELWYGKVSNLSDLKVWGCEALVKRDTLDKLQ